MSEQTEVSKTEVNQVMNVADIKSHVAVIHKVMTEVMKVGTHYDKIKGCGDKNVLLKAGAEKILATFMLAPEFIVEDMSTDINKYYRVTTRLTHQATKTFMGSGIGECSSLENKYAWREAVCDDEFDDTPDNQRRVHYKKGWNNAPTQKIKQVRQDMYTLSNTILKMSKKRSLIDAVMNVTACSDIFVQDLDESHIRDAVKDEAKENKLKASILKAFKDAPDVKTLIVKMDKAKAAGLSEMVLSEVTSAFIKRKEELTTV